MIDDPGTLNIGEVHPMAHDAMQYIKDYLLYNMMDSYKLIESLASTAMSGNRISEVCYETLRRIREGEPVSDRYLLGLAWFIKVWSDNKDKK